MRSFRASLAVRTALSTLAIVTAISAASITALRSLLYGQLDRTLLHLAEVEARAGADATGPDFAFHEGVLLASREGPAAELTRYAQLWTRDGQPLVRTRNLTENLLLPADALQTARGGGVGWATYAWRGRTLRSVVYPLQLVGAAHGVHLLQVAAPTEPISRTLVQFGLLVALFTAAAAALAYGAGWQLAGVALRPTREITEQAQAIEAGTLSARITAHADVAEFESLLAVLNGMLDRLDRAFQVQQRFITDASHELRAPLNVLRGDVEVALKRDRDAAEYRATLERCRDEVIGLCRLVENLLALARSDAGRPLAHVGELDVCELAIQVADRYRTLGDARSVQIEVTGDSAIAAGDRRVLARVVGNLVDNAVKFSPPGGRVRVEVANGAEVTLTVRDEGAGIAVADLDQLFTRFFRADPARPRADGTGLGLAIARAGAEAHGGRLEFLGNHPGATFRLTLPGVPTTLQLG
ncbi:MAG: sensor histidine kinase [Gemmatimonadales bacterium]